MTTSFRPQRAKRSVAGFSLIEVLVSIVVLSFGLLGMVGLQAASIQANRDARLQSTATTLARELAEMMRGNKDIALSTTANNPYLVSSAHPLAPATASYCLAVGQSCATPLAVGQAEVTDWLARVDDALPGAKVVICRDSQPFDTSSGVPLWGCTSASTDDQIVIKIGWTQNNLRTGGAQVQAAQPSIVIPVTAGSGTL